MSANPSTTTSWYARPVWDRGLGVYQQPSLRLALGQVVPTLAVYLSLMVVMILMVRAGYSYGIILALAAVAGAFLARILGFFHDACHRSFFRASWANTLLGYLCGILAFTPYHAWRARHLKHHASVGDLDRRGVGDIWTMTAEEYYAAPKRVQIAYRLFRNPLVMFGLWPIEVLIVQNRLISKDADQAQHFSVHTTTLIILFILATADRTIGLPAYIAVQLPVLVVAGAINTWLAYVQHQFPGTYWVRHEKWNPIQAALKGSSYYRLPGVLRWFSANSGLSHIHYLRPRIPNYNLQRCYDQTPELQQVTPLTLRTSLACTRLSLWDEQQEQLVSLASLRRQLA